MVFKCSLMQYKCLQVKKKLVEYILKANFKCVKGLFAWSNLPVFPSPKYETSKTYCKFYLLASQKKKELNLK